MSGDSPGYVPPDHTNTAEFAIRGRRSADPGPTPDDTLTDAPGPGAPPPPDDDPQVDDGPPPSDDPPPVETITDFPAPVATVTDLPEAAASAVPAGDVDTIPEGAEVDVVPPPSNDLDLASVTVTDVPIPRREDPDAIPFGTPAPNDTAPSEPVAPPAPAEDDWTAMFGAEPVGLAEPSADADAGAGAPGHHESPAPPPVPDHPTPPVGAPSGEAVVALGAEGIPPKPETRRTPAGPPSPSSAGPHTGDRSVAGGTPPSGSRAAFGVPPTGPSGPSGPSGAPGTPGTPAGGGSGIGGVTAPSGTPTPAPGGRRRRPWPLVALAVGVLLVLAGVGATMLLGGSSGKDDAAATATPAVSSPGTETGSPEPTSSASPEPTGGPSDEPPGSASPTEEPTGGPSESPSGTPGATPPPTEAPESAPSGPVTRGNGITYQIVQQSQGYFEGQFVVTNPGSAPLTGWKITFDTPRADVHSIWGAELVHGGTHVEIDGTVAIPPGGSWTVRFGATGMPARPEGCQLAGRACGF